MTLGGYHPWILVFEAHLSVANLGSGGRCHLCYRTWKRMRSPKGQHLLEEVLFQTLLPQGQSLPEQSQISSILVPRDRRPQTLPILEFVERHPESPWMPLAKQSEQVVRRHSHLAPAAAVKNAARQAMQLVTLWQPQGRGGRFDLQKKAGMICHLKNLGHQLPHHYHCALSQQPTRRLSQA